MSRCVCRSREKRDGQTDRQTKEHTQCRCETYQHASGQAGLTRFEGVVDWAGDASLPCEQGAAEAHVVSRVSDAELGQQQLPGRPLHQESVRPSVRHRPSAGRGGSGSPCKVICGRAYCSSVFFRRSDSKNEHKAATLSLCGRVAV